MRKFYTHNELVEKLERAQFEIQRLKSRPDMRKHLKGMLVENKRLHDLVNELMAQRNDLLSCLKLHEKTKY
jgi:hypothetical protein